MSRRLTIESLRRIPFHPTAISNEIIVRVDANTLDP